MNAALAESELLGPLTVLLHTAGHDGPAELVPLAGGANNRVFRVELPETTLVLKSYFHHPGDPRDRLAAEFGFASFAWTHGIRALAQPIACDARNRLALYEYLPGDKLAPHEVTRATVQQAIDFYVRLNDLRDEPDAHPLHAASEACFRLQDHLHCLERRMQRLERIDPEAVIDREAARFVRQDLAPVCASLIRAAEVRFRTQGLSLDAPLAVEDRCLSPSDFGFHNALRGADGCLRFLDFEYAGWDDPAKTAADFFCQPACPVPLTYFEEVADAMVRHTSRPALHLRRIRVLLVIYQLKWCCILLNDFLPAAGQRRRFALSADDEHCRKAAQLHKARAALATINARTQ